MIPLPLPAITPAALSALIGTARESRTLEFKEKMPDPTKVIQGVSALANTSGGDFVIGVRTTDDGVAQAIDGIPVQNVDQETLRLEQLIRDGLEPRLPTLQIRTIPAAIPGRYVLILRTPRSWIAPHRVIKNNRFYARNAAGNYPLDVSELRAAFVLADRAVDRIRAFQADRLAKIVAGETPAALGVGALIVHVVPAPAASTFDARDFATAVQRGTHFPLPLSGMSGSAQPRFNLDGIVNADLMRNEGIYSYAQMFRAGAIEGAFPLSVRGDGAPYFISGTVKKIVAGVQQYVDVLSSLEVGFPLYALISICSAQPVFLRTAAEFGSGYYDRGPLRGPCITLPDSAIESGETDVASAVRPALDALWNGFGLAGYDG